MASIETPCIRICVVHPILRLCRGCGRSLDEIARWIDLSEAERTRIMAQLPPRLVAMSGGTPVTSAMPSDATQVMA
jgi:hypothetical protein